jgi:dihydrofolate reductase
VRKVILFMATTLDGYYAGPDDEIDWHIVDDEYKQFASDQLSSVDVILFGRVTYEGMASYWQTPAAFADDPIIAERMNSLPKIVFSTTLSAAEWTNTRLIKENISEEIGKLKQQSGKDLIIFGSANLSRSFIELGLLDELRILVNPVVIGNGKSLFAGVSHRHNLKLLKSTTFSTGSVLLYYEPERSNS